MIKRFSTRALFAFLFSLVAAGAVFPLGSAYGGWFSGIGVLEGGTSSVGGLSADGQVVVGASAGQPILWTRLGGISPLVAGGGFSGGAYGASGDGSVIVGTGVFSGSLWQAFRWTAASGMQNLGTPDAHSIAVGVSGDGSAVVGSDCPTSGYAFYWTAPGPMVHTGSGGAAGISDDGTVIVGQDSGSGSFGTAMKWTRNGSGGWEPTPLPSSSGRDVATDATPKGDVIVGLYDYSASPSLGFLWTASGVEYIPIQAQAVSDNGTLIAGTLGAGPGWNGNEAYLWDSVNGARTVKSVLLGLGLTEASDWKFSYVVDISGDGTVIAGTGYNLVTKRQEGWVANLEAVPAPASVFIWVGLASLGVLWGRQGRRSKSAA